MADKMMRVAGRDPNGVAKAMKTDESGNLGVRLSGSTAKSTLNQLMDFAGKKNGNNEVPHISKVLVNASSTSPFLSSFTLEITDTNYGRIGVKDIPGGVMLTTATTAGYYPLQLFGFDLLKDLKNKGRIPSTWTVADLRQNAKQLTVEWIGKAEGSNAGTLANGATLKLLSGLNSWIDMGTHTSIDYATITNAYKTPNALIQDDGFVYYLAHANHPTDATIQAKVYTDYISVDVKLDADVLLTDFSKAFDETTRRLKTTSVMSQSSLQRRTTVSNELVVNAGATAVLLDNYELKDNVTAWGLHGLEINRPTTEIANGLLEIIVEYSNVSGNFSKTQGSGKVTFSKIIKFSDVEDVNKAFATIADPSTSTGTNLIVSGKFFNIPLAKYMKITIKNANSNAFRFLPFVLVEEGNF